MPDLAVDECLDPFGEFGLFEAANIYIDRAIVIDERERWLIEDIEFGPNDPVDIDEVIERSDGILVDEIFHRRNVVGSARQANEGDFVTEL